MRYDKNNWNIKVDWNFNIFEKNIKPLNIYVCVYHLYLYMQLYSHIYIYKDSIPDWLLQDFLAIVLINIYRGNKITIYSLKLRELSTLILTRYTYFLLSVSRQGASNTPQRKFNCTQYNCRKYQLKNFQHKLILSTSRIFIFFFTTRIAQAATLQSFVSSNETSPRVT